MDGNDLGRAAQRAADSDAVEKMARVGYGASALVHLLIGWIALRLALGTSTGDADQSGAFAQLASHGVGRILLWVAVVGFIGLAFWQVMEAVRRHETSDRLKAGGKAVAYVAMAITAWPFAVGGGSSQKSEQDSVGITASLMSKPAGVFLVGAVGLAVVGIGIYHVIKGAKKKFLSDLEKHPGEAAVRLGQVGYIAKGSALVVVGGLFLTAAVQHDSKQARGLDGALKTILGAPFGRMLLGLVALGFLAFAAYSFVRARHARV